MCKVKNNSETVRIRVTKNFQFLKERMIYSIKTAKEAYYHKA